MAQIFRLRREHAVEGGGADGEGVGAGMGDGGDALGAVDRACHDDWFRGGAAYGRDQCRDVAGEPVGEQIEAVDTVHFSHSRSTFNDFAIEPESTLGWPTTLPGKGQ